MDTTLHLTLTITQTSTAYTTDEILLEDDSQIYLEPSTNYYLSYESITSYFDPLLTETDSELLYEDIAYNIYIAKES